MLPGILVAGFVKSFQPVSSTIVYVLDVNSVLWRVQGTQRQQVDVNVKAFQAIDANLVYVLSQDTNATLWRVRGTQQFNDKVDSSVGDFQAMDASIVYVLGAKDSKLWRVNGTQHNDDHVDDEVAEFQGGPGRSDVVYVLGAKDRRLWRVQGSQHHDDPVDADVKAFQAIDAQNVYVLGGNGSLWRVNGTQQHHDHVDDNVAAFKAVDSQYVYVLGQDNKLWRETANNNFRYMVDYDVQSCWPVDKDVVFVLKKSGELWRNKRQELFIGVGDDDPSGLFAGFLNAPGSWTYVAGNCNGYYISSIAIQNAILKVGETQLRVKLNQLAQLFANKNVFYESDVATTPQDDIKYLDLLLDYFATVPYSALNDAQPVNGRRAPVSTLTNKLAALRHRDGSRPVLAMQGPWTIGGDLHDSSQGAVDECNWIDGMDGSATDGPLGRWHQDWQQMQHGSVSMVRYPQGVGKIAMTMLASVTSGSPTAFLNFGQACVNFQEANDAIPNIWAISYYDAVEQPFPVTPESVGGQPAATITGLAYWLLQHLRGL